MPAGGGSILELGDTTTMMQRLSLRGGWTTFLLVALVVFTATWSVQWADWADGLQILTVITLSGLLVGLVLAEQERVPPVLAHLAALVVGALVVLYEVTGFLSSTLGSRTQRLDYLWVRWQHWFQAVSHGQRADDLYLFILLMAALLWLLSYVSVWFVFRSHWVWLTLLLPGVVLLLDMGYSDRVPTSLVVLYVFAAILLLMRFTFAEREISWRRFSVPFPESLPWRGFWVASYLGLTVILAGWVLPVSLQSSQIVSAWDHVNGPWRNLEDSFNQWFSSLRGPAVPGSGGFTAFGDKFQLGGPLKLSNDPVVLLKGSVAPYLIAHTYDVFTGSGWQSDVDQTFHPTPNQTSNPLSPLLQYDGGQSIPIPTSTTKSRVSQQSSVQILQPRGAVIYSSGQPSQVSVPVQVQVSWYTYSNQVLDVKTATQQSTPPMLWPLVSLLQSADFTPPATPTATPGTTSVATPGASSVATPDATPSTTPGATPTATPAPPGPPDTSSAQRALTTTPGITGQGRSAQTDAFQQRRDILQAQRALQDKGIQTRWQVGSDYKVLNMTFSGQLPVMADVEALYARDGVRSGDQYQVQSLVSQATPAQLRVAGTDYPPEITQRYLQLPAYSDRTKALAESLVQGRNNPYDVAANIEAWLRQNMRYNENVSNPPANRDLVDYFLFDSKQGYCTYYASAMAEMLRILGIPSRVDVGFYPADFDSASAGYLYRDRNAHAWVEAYFPGYGWIPFEPTSARSPISRGAPATSPVSISASAAGTDNSAAQSRFDELQDPGLGGGGGGVVVTTSQDSRLTWVLRGGIGLVLLGFAVVTFLWVRGTRGMTPAARFFTKVERGAGWGGVPADPSMTPFEYASIVGRRMPGSRQHVQVLAELYVRERYGTRPPTSAELSRARTAWLRLRSLIVRYALLQRWRVRPSETVGDD
ncbi:MAG TPA: transglutaminase domain-containing protein [Thermomicrobiaceae bacterium]|nr:transglutaminase domain-containing protein [Thermomicrobiaceae bacterium]